MWPELRPHRPQPRTLLLAAAVAAGVLAELAAPAPYGRLGAVADLAVGVAYLACGPLLWDRAGNRFAVLLGSVGLAWFIGGLWPAALFAHRGPLIHAVVAGSSGRLRRLPARVVVAAGYVTAVSAPLGRSDVATVLLGSAVAAVALDGHLRESGARRRARTAVTAAALAVALVLVAGAAARLGGHPAPGVTLAVYESTLVLVAVGLGVDALRRGWVQDAVAGLVVDLGAVTEAATLRDQLAHALGDNSLLLGFWIEEEQGYVDDAGRPVLLPGQESGRVLTPIESHGRQVAALVHDPGSLDDPALLAAAGEAIRVAVANVRLQATVRLQVQQLEDSRRRIVEAAARQRVLLARELEEGAARRLLSVADHLASLHEAGATPRAVELTAEVAQQLEAARRELDELARGIHPAALTHGGLLAALPSLAARASLPVDVSVEADRLPAALEAAAYFVCSEALANAEKHAGASTVRMRAVTNDGVLVVSVHDDGAGGADPAGGSGLRGLADRVEALGGSLVVHSPAEHGTEVRAVLPLTAPR